MSLKIRIKQHIPPEQKPSKRRIQKIDSDDEEGAANVAEPRPKRSRKHSRAVSPDSEAHYLANVVDEDVDIDGDIEDTRFLPDPSPSIPISRSSSPAAAPSLKLKFTNPSASSSKPRPKEKESSKAAKSNKSVKKPRRQVVYTDSEDEAFDDPDIVVTDDDDFEPEPDYSNKKGARVKSGKTVAGVGKTGVKGRVRLEEEISYRDERRAPPGDIAKRARPEENVSKSTVPDPLDDPIPKKRKLPPIKKNKPVGSVSTGPSTPASSKPSTAVPSEKKEKESLTPAPTSNQVGVRKVAGASSDINLLDSSVYSELFKSAPGGVTPDSGLNRKRKEEERRKELNRMRMEARAKREAEGRHAFNLQAAPEKIQRFEDVLRTRHSMARYPNIIGAAFKEIFERQGAIHTAAAAVGHR